MKRYIQFKKNGQFILPIYDSKGNVTGLPFPFDAPVSFNVANDFFTPVPDLMNFLIDAISDGPLSLLSAIPSAIEDGAKMLGVTAKPRGYYASAWQDTKPLSFTITLDLKFGWRGLYSGYDEIRYPADALIDASLPYMDSYEIGPLKFKNVIQAPGPNGIDAVITAMSQLMEQVKNMLGPLGDLIPKDKPRKYEKDINNPENYLIACRYNIATRQYEVISVITGGGKAGGDISWSDPNVLNSQNTEANKAFAAQAKASADAFTKEVQAGRVPESYMVNMDKGFSLGGQGAFSASGARTVTDVTRIESRADLVEDSVRSSAYAKDALGTSDIILIPLNTKTTTRNDPKKSNDIQTDFEKHNVWDVIINGTMTLTNLVLDSLTYQFGNEQDSSGFPTTAVLNLSFITQEIPVSLFNHTGTNFMKM